MYIQAHCSDCFNAEYNGKEYDGYVIDRIGIGGDDDVSISYCLDCGKIQGNFPIKEEDVQEAWRTYLGEEEDE